MLVGNYGRVEQLKFFGNRRIHSVFKNLALIFSFLNLIPLNTTLCSDH